MLQLDAAQNLARVLSRDADVAEDIVQEAFLQAYRGFQGYEGGDPRAWIFAIVRNCHRQWLRQQRRKMRLEVENTSSSSPDEDRAKNVASDADTPEMTLLRPGESMAVQLVINNMPRPMREMLVLRELEGLSYRQIEPYGAADWNGDVTPGAGTRAFPSSVAPTEVGVTRMLVRWTAIYRTCN